jgi:N-acetylneuraminate synthase
MHRATIMPAHNRFPAKIKIGSRWIGEGQPAYIIADIGANFDGSLDKAKQLALAVKEAGGDVVKIQSFLADKIVSGRGFASMKLKGVHGSWGRPVDEIFREVEFPRAWHKEFFDYCRKIGIAASSSPYDLGAVDLMEKSGVDFYKIGSGDITWHEMLEYIARKGKPMILATGAATLAEIDEAVKVIEATGNRDLALLQCITNYPSKIESANIRVMDTYAQAFGTIIGYSDHAPGDTVVLGAIARGAKVVEKHFTLNKKDKGPDHPHSMEPQEFALMVRRIRDMEKALGTGRKEVVAEESETVIVQRRGLSARKDLAKDAVLKVSDIVELRPALGIPPKFKGVIAGKRLKRSRKAGEPIRWEDVA